VAELLVSLHRKVVQALVDKLDSGEASAADLNVARAMLRDNGVAGDPDNPEQAIMDLTKKLAELDLELPN
jgi:hypothetical protein